MLLPRWTDGLCQDADAEQDSLQYQETVEEEKQSDPFIGLAQNKLK